MYGDSESGVYRIAVNHEQGRIDTFLDSITRNPLYEHQQIVPERVPVTNTRNVTNEGVELQVAFTHPTGPARVSVTDGDGAVAGATITIGNQRVGLTDDSGSAWIIQPGDTDDTGSTFRITVTTPDDRLVSVSGV